MPWCKAPGHQYPQCWLNIHCIWPFSCKNFILKRNNVHFKNLYLKHFQWNWSQASATKSHWWWVNIDSGNGLVSSGNDPWPLSQCWPIYVSPYSIARSQWVNLSRLQGWCIPGLIPGLCPANERRHYFVTMSLIENQPCLPNHNPCIILTKVITPGSAHSTSHLGKYFNGHNPTSANEFHRNVFFNIPQPNSTEMFSSIHI